ncbi:hypothetical protein OG417_53335 [Actinoallomurus sp. NBC_01490]|uniref:SDH family Clp fold serine proteinase n=1 Tax=Actinoallomurus sp. NBC_01490 TaxID=2903557 RepID=UPI002E357712|nr:hypothetical protein [Actinoallomurus sp. NBC_01490]
MTTVTMVRRLPELESLRGNAALVYCGKIDHDAPRTLHEALREIGHVPRLDLVLATYGGAATAARRLGLLLHEFTDRLTILIPDRAWSAGTLLSLCAHELVMTPMAELGPLDPRLESPGGTPAVISSGQIHAFRTLAEEWFAMKEGEDVLALLTQRMLPATLGAFYQAERLTRQIAIEFLGGYQLAGEDIATVEDIVEQLMTGYHAHDYPITRRDAMRLGLRVECASGAEETILYDAVAHCREDLARLAATSGGPAGGGPDVRD